MGYAVGNRRSDIMWLVQSVRRNAEIRNKHIDTIDPFLKVGRTLFPLLPKKKLYDYARTALRVYLVEQIDVYQQTTLNSHLGYQLGS
jgi:hypothetical protein